MTNDNDLLLLASSQDNETYKVYIDSNGRKTLTPQTANYEAIYPDPFVYNSTTGLLSDKDPKKVVFPNCSKVSGSLLAGGNPRLYYHGAFRSNFLICKSLTSVSFPVLTTATGANSGNNHYGEAEGAFQDAFPQCTSLTSVSFPALTTATGSTGNGTNGNHGAFQSAFSECRSLTSITFPALIKATGSTGSGGGNYGAFATAFRYCSSLKYVSFPSLRFITESTSYDATFYQAFDQCSTTLEVHFKKSMKGKKGLDYKTMGLRRADQVVFDLP